MRRPPCPKVNNRENVDEHRDDDNEGNGYYRGVVETISGESNGDNCYLALGSRKDRMRE